MLQRRRHQLVRLTDGGWTDVLQRPWIDAERDCVAHWARHRLPLVVTRQSAGASGGDVDLGLAAPPAWGRLRLPIRIASGSVLQVDGFPAAVELLATLPATAQQPCHQLFGMLAALHADARVYGSFGWQHLTGLRYVTDNSDLDLQLSVGDALHADKVAGVMSGQSSPELRLDGELTFPDGTAVAWREWQQWRAGSVDRILVKRLHGVSMETGGAWLRDRHPC